MIFFGFIAQEPSNNDTDPYVLFSGRTCQMCKQTRVAPNVPRVSKSLQIFTNFWGQKLLSICKSSETIVASQIHGTVYLTDFCSLLVYFFNASLCFRIYPDICKYMNQFGHTLKLKGEPTNQNPKDNHILTTI